MIVITACDRPGRESLCSPLRPLSPGIAAPARPRRCEIAARPAAALRSAGGRSILRTSAASLPAFLDSSDTPASASSTACFSARDFRDLPNPQRERLAFFGRLGRLGSRWRWGWFGAALRPPTSSGGGGVRRGVIGRSFRRCGLWVPHTVSAVGVRGRSSCPASSTAVSSRFGVSTLPQVSAASAVDSAVSVSVAAATAVDSSVSVSDAAAGSGCATSVSSRPRATSKKSRAFSGAVAPPRRSDAACAPSP